MEYIITFNNKNNKNYKKNKDSNFRVQAYEMKKQIYLVFNLNFFKILLFVK